MSPTAQQPQGFHQQHLVSRQLQGMAHGTALHPMAAPGVVPQGVVGQLGAGPSQGFAGAVAGADAQEWQKESGGFINNARSVPSATLCLCVHLMVWSSTKSRCMSMCMSMSMCMYMYKCIRMCVCLCTYTCRCMCICVCMYACQCKVVCIDFCTTPSNTLQHLSVVYTTDVYMVHCTSLRVDS